MVGVNLSINSATLRVSRRNSIRYTISFHYYFSTFPFAFASRLETPTWYPMQIPFCITTVEYLLCQWSNVYLYTCIHIFIFKYSTLRHFCMKVYFYTSNNKMWLQKGKHIFFLKKYVFLILQQIFIRIYIYIFFKWYTVIRVSIFWVFMQMHVLSHLLTFSTQDNYLRHITFDSVTERHVPTRGQHSNSVISLKIDLHSITCLTHTLEWLDKAAYSRYAAKPP